MPTLPSRCVCGQIPGHHTRDKGDYTRHEICCACGANAYAGSWAEVLQIWDEMSAKKPIVTIISRGKFIDSPREVVDEGFIWPWVEAPDGAKVIVDHQQLEDAVFFADQCEQSLQRESESAGKVMLHDRALKLVQEQADDIALWQGNDLHKVRAALRFLHMAVEGGLKNPLFDLLRGKQ